MRYYRSMARLTDHVSYADAQRLCSPARLWELFDGDRERLNIGHECIDRHPAAEAAVRIVRAPEQGGGDEILTFGALAAWSARFAHLLADRGVPGRETVVAADALLAALGRYPERYAPETRADDLAVFQYTSGTTRELP